MARKKKVYRASTLPRYKSKMYDYISKGGRIPMILAMEVVNAMGDAWVRGYAKYADSRDMTIERAAKDLPHIPKIYYGLAKGLLMRIMKLASDKGMSYQEALELVCKENDLPTGDPVRQLLEKAVEKLQGKK